MARSVILSAVRTPVGKFRSAEPIGDTRRHPRIRVARAVGRKHRAARDGHCHAHSLGSETRANAQTDSFTPAMGHTHDCSNSDRSGSRVASGPEHPSSRQRRRDRWMPARDRHKCPRVEHAGDARAIGLLRAARMPEHWPATIRAGDRADCARPSRRVTGCDDPELSHSAGTCRA